MVAADLLIPLFPPPDVLQKQLDSQVQRSRGKTRERWLPRLPAAVGFLSKLGADAKGVNFTFPEE